MRLTKLCLAIIVLLFLTNCGPHRFIVPLGAQVLPTSTLTGKIALGNGRGVTNGTITLQLSQAAYIAGQFSAATQSFSCYTGYNGQNGLAAQEGQIVGLPDPITRLTITANYGAGTLPATTYYVTYTYYSTSPAYETLPSPQQTFVMVSPGTMILQAPALRPASALGWRAYVSTTSGAGQLQVSNSGFSNISIAAALISGATAPTTNNSKCAFWFNDTLIPSRTTYQMNVIDGNANQVAGYPQNYAFFGSTVDISNMTPAGNLPALYPTALIQNPSSGATQSINGGLTITGNLLVQGTMSFPFITFPSLGSEPACPAGNGGIFYWSGQLYGCENGGSPVPFLAGGAVWNASVDLAHMNALSATGFMGSFTNADVVFGANNNEIFRITGAAPFMGVGTQTPARHLEVYDQGSGAQGIPLRITGPTSAGGKGVQIELAEGSSGVTASLFENQQGCGLTILTVPASGASSLITIAPLLQPVAQFNGTNFSSTLDSRVIVAHMGDAGFSGQGALEIDGIDTTGPATCVNGAAVIYFNKHSGTNLTYISENCGAFVPLLGGGGGGGGWPIGSGAGGNYTGPGSGATLSIGTATADQLVFATNAGKAGGITIGQNWFMGQGSTTATIGGQPYTLNVTAANASIAPTYGSIAVQGTNASGANIDLYSGTTLVSSLIGSTLTGDTELISYSTYPLDLKTNGGTLGLRINSSQQVMFNTTTPFTDGTNTAWMTIAEPSTANTIGLVVSAPSTQYATLGLVGNGSTQGLEFVATGGALGNTISSLGPLALQSTSGTFPITANLQFMVNSSTAFEVLDGPQTLWNEGGSALSHYSVVEIHGSGTNATSAKAFPLILDLAAQSGTIASQLVLSYNGGGQAAISTTAVGTTLQDT